MPTETVELHGHIIDSLILPKVLDEILNEDGSFEIEEIRIGKERTDLSYARVQVEAPTAEQLSEILHRIKQQGAELVHEGDVRLALAPADGVFPEGFYVSTNQDTLVRYQGTWIPVRPSRMDCGIALDPETRSAAPRKFSQVRKGEQIIVGDGGVRVIPVQRSTERNVFEFMASSVSSEKPKAAIVRAIADEMRAARAQGGKILVVGGPTIVHTGAGRHLVRLIELGYVDRLFAGNALAVHDIEEAFFGTALGVHVERGTPAEEGHEHHIRAINRIRAAGGIRAAVEQGILTSGVMHACVKHGVEYVLAGSIRDDGPLPDVITDAIEAQKAMLTGVEGVSVALMIATALHSIATGNLLPATTKTVCVDINPAVVTKLADRGTFQAIGLVTDVEPFFVELLDQLESDRE
jgi:lysine-ketoglutarate reductase/saccharopine dehydrogenase-like protein (TIGR00300 family)